MKLIKRSLTVAAASLGVAFLIPAAVAQDVAERVTSAIEADPEDICDIVKNAIEAGGDVKTVVKAAALAAPDQSATIAECAIAAAPDAEGEIREALQEAFEDVDLEMAKFPLDIRGIYLIPPVAPSSASVESDALSFQELLDAAEDEDLSLEELIELLRDNRDGLPRRQTGSPSDLGS